MIFFFKGSWEWGSGGAGSPFSAVQRATESQGLSCVVEQQCAVYVAVKPYVTSNVFFNVKPSLFLGRVGI